MMKLYAKVFIMGLLLHWIIDFRFLFYCEICLMGDDAKFMKMSKAATGTFVPFFLVNLLSNLIQLICESLIEKRDPIPQDENSLISSFHCL